MTLHTSGKESVVPNGTASDWAPVTIGVSQGSVLVQVLFITYINDVDDDTKMGNSIITDHDWIIPQEDLRKISEWSQK